MGYAIRPETPLDADAIRSLTTAAFENAEHSDGNEAAIVDALRSADALSVSLVATMDGEVVGHVAFSPVTIEGSDIGWFGLGPVSVLPDRQGKGIGADLIKRGLERLRAIEAKGCVLLGDPDYYRRFGFKADQALELAGVPTEYFMSMSLVGSMPRGAVRYHAAFDAS